MKCPACWSDKAYRHPAKGWRRIALRLLLLVPMKCHHCFHKFKVHRLFAIGKRLDAPAKTVAAVPRRIAQEPPAAQPARRKAA